METKKIIIPVGWEVVAMNDREIILEQKKLPKTWEDFCENNPMTMLGIPIYTDSEFIQTNENEGSRQKFPNRVLVPNKDTASAVLALCQLISLQNYYRQGWKPDWTDEEVKYSIVNAKNRISKGITTTMSSPLTFPTEELRDEFLDNFKDLCERAKDLL